jgi:two-component system, NarL family, nitrate/nitrite response regulator NarL
MECRIGRKMATRVLIVEDHDLLAQSLRFALQADGLEVEQCSVHTADGILKAAIDLRPEIILLDLDLGGELGTSLRLIPELQATGARIVMLTGVTDRARLGECVEAGAIGIVSKAEPFDRLLTAVQEAVELGTLLSPGQRDELMAELRRQRQDDEQRLQLFSTLTKREQQVLAALLDGKAAETIAEDWVLSVATVRSQIRSLLMKLRVNSQLSAVSLARKAGWSPDEQGGS